MPEIIRYPVLPVPDLAMLRALSAFADRIGPTSKSRILYKYSTAGDAPSIVASPDSDDMSGSIPGGGIGYAIVYAQMRISVEPYHVSVDYSRGTGVDQVLVSYDSVHGQAAPKGQMIQSWAQAIHEVLPSTDWRATLETLMGDERVALHAQREADFQKLNQLVIDLGSKTADVVETRLEYLTKKEADLDQKYRARELELEAVYRERQVQFDEKHRRTTEEFDRRQGLLSAELAAREKELEDRRRSLDDRDAKHARRGMRNEMKERLKEHSTQYGLTAGTQQMRTPVHIAFLFLCFVFVGGALWAAAHIGDGQEPVVVAWSIVRSLLLGLAFGATALFYLRWLNGWFERHAAEEFRLKRLELDIDRASWVVETLLEASTEGEGKVPPELVDRLTRGLFEEGSPTDPIQHPVDQLATLLRAAANVDLKLPGGAEVTFDKKGLGK